MLENTYVYNVGLQPSFNVIGLEIESSAMGGGVAPTLGAVPLVWKILATLISAFASELFDCATELPCICAEQLKKNTNKIVDNVMDLQIVV